METRMETLPERYVQMPDLTKPFGNCPVKVLGQISRTLFVYRSEWERAKKDKARLPEYSRSLPTGVKERWWWSKPQTCAWEDLECYAEVASGHQVLTWTVVLVPDGAVFQISPDSPSVHFEIDPIASGLVPETPSAQGCTLILSASKTFTSTPEAGRWIITACVAIAELQKKLKKPE